MDWAYTAPKLRPAQEYDYLADPLVNDDTAASATPPQTARALRLLAGSTDTAPPSPHTKGASSPRPDTSAQAPYPLPRLAPQQNPPAPHPRWPRPARGHRGCPSCAGVARWWLRGSPDPRVGGRGRGRGRCRDGGHRAGRRPCDWPVTGGGVGVGARDVGWVAWRGRRPGAPCPCTRRSKPVGAGRWLL